ncbi:MAG: orotate phosphoribosyltransferase [Flavobacteriales bacterium]
MKVNKDLSLKVAELLLKTKAVRLQPENPFTWASGWKSPIYCDNRITLSFPEVRTFIRQGYAQTILEHFGKPDVIAGVATGGIAQGALIAQELGLPFIYVRSSAKGHGMENLIEGAYESGQRVVVIEDLISTGGSSLKAVEALRQGGLDVKGLVAIFTYGFSLADQQFEAAKCPYITLTDYGTLIDVATKTSYVNEANNATLQAWRNNPSTWMQE